MDGRRRSLEARPMTDLSDLRKRVEAASGPDSGLYRAIFEACGFKTHKSGALLWALDYVGDVAITDNLNAALSLVENVLPEWIWDVTSTGSAWVMSPRGKQHIARHFTPPSPTLAVLSALLAALDSRAA